MCVIIVVILINVRKMGDYMSVNRGKDFENVVRQCFEREPGVSIDRLHDQTTGYAGSSNICDFIVYKYPNIFYIECKSVHGNRLSIHSNDPKKKYGAISNKQWEGLVEKSDICSPGIIAGVMCWWIDHDVTLFIPIETLCICRNVKGQKSVAYDDFNTKSGDTDAILVPGKKKRVFFDYDMKAFLSEF